MEKPARRTHKERTDESDAQMLDAAEKLILEVGAHKTTLKEVGENAGYSRGLAHSRYGSKEVLFMRLAERCVENWLNTLRIEGAGKTGIKALTSRLDSVITYAKKYPEDARVLYVLWFESVGMSGPMREQLGRFHHAARKDIEDIVTQAQDLGEIDKGIDKGGFALHLTSSFFGLSYQWLVSPDSVSVEKSVRLFRDYAVTLLQK